MRTITVLLWKYSDGSGAGLIRAYENAIEANNMKALLEDQGSFRTYECITVDLVEEPAILRPVDTAEPV